jgi:hypothetical protein
VSLASLGSTLPLALRNRFEDGSASHPGIQLWKAVGSMTKSQRCIVARCRLEGLACSVAGTMGAPHAAARSSCSHHDDGMGIEGSAQQQPVLLLVLSAAVAGPGR